jgi:quercetin dioxygenase-like cupin family protein
VKPLVFARSAYFEEQVSVMELYVFPKTGNQKQHHTLFDKMIEILDGELSVNHNKTTSTLKTGESVVIPIGSIHSFKNKTDRKCRIRITLKPGSTDFEDAMNIYFGLKRDGRLHSNGSPKRISDAALLNWLSNSKTNTIKQIILDCIANRAIRRGGLEILRNRYTY